MSGVLSTKGLHPWYTGPPSRADGVHGMGTPGHRLPTLGGPTPPGRAAPRGPRRAASAGARGQPSPFRGSWVRAAGPDRTSPAAPLPVWRPSSSESLSGGQVGLCGGCRLSSRGREGGGQVGTTPHHRLGLRAQQPSLRSMLQSAAGDRDRETERSETQRETHTWGEGGSLRGKPSTGQGLGGSGWLQMPTEETGWGRVMHPAGPQGPGQPPELGIEWPA